MEADASGAPSGVTVRRVRRGAKTLAPAVVKAGVFAAVPR
jgi:hypothetical protein